MRKEKWLGRVLLNFVLFRLGLIYALVALPLCFLADRLGTSPLAGYLGFSGVMGGLAAIYWVGKKTDF